MAQNNHRKEKFTREDFLEHWEICRSWFETGPKSYKGKYYIRRWGEENTDPIEQVLITSVPDDISVIIELSWELAINKTCEQVNENTVKIFSEELYYELPFRNSRNADIYAAFENNSEELRDKYIGSFKPVRSLKDIFETNEANCVAHALAIKETIPDKSFQIFNNYYEYTSNPEFMGKIGIHTILAKLEHGAIYAIDSSEGPNAHKDKYNPFMYKMTPEHFSKNYIPACIRPSYCGKNIDCSSAPKENS